MEKIDMGDSAVAKACEVLKAGGVVMHPTETCYGLAADISNPEALDKIYRAKMMGKDKPVSILVSDLEMAMRYGEFSDKAVELASVYWPGPLSIVVPRTPELPKCLNPAEEFVSIRFADHDFCIRMVAAFGTPVTTTSANITGTKQLYDAKDLGDLKGVDLLVDAGRIDENQPSTIVKVVDDEIQVLRKGSIELSE